MNTKRCDICQSEADTLYNLDGKQVCEYCLTISTECIMSCDSCHRPIADEALYEYKCDVLCRDCLLRMAKIKIKESEGDADVDQDRGQ